jgi:medium-chain acyl-[acyl-carrier-protein] hydrolase
MHAIGSLGSNGPHISKADVRSDKWLLIPQRKPQASLKLFCFPFAGGNGSVFMPWAARLPADVELNAVQLPGRGARISETPINNIQQMARACADALAPLLDRPFVFFGHSMGAMLAFELTRELRRRGLPLPQQLLVSACRAPHFELGREPLHALPKPQFLDAIANLKGTPEAAISNRELMDLLEPVLRADFTAAESWTYKSEAPLPMPIAVFGGDQDHWVARPALSAWREHTSSGFWQQSFAGDHFYILQQTTALVQQITQLLCIAPRRVAV